MIELSLLAWDLGSFIPFGTKRHCSHLAHCCVWPLAITCADLTAGVRTFLSRIAVKRTVITVRSHYVSYYPITCGLFIK